jgi:hypothetical protein
MEDMYLNYLSNIEFYFYGLLKIHELRCTTLRMVLVFVAKTRFKANRMNVLSVDGH